MDLRQTLALAEALEVNLGLRKAGDGLARRIWATPRENITLELDAGIRDNRDDLIKHLERMEESDFYRLCYELAGIPCLYLRVRDGQLYATPRALVPNDVAERIRAHKDNIIKLLTADEDRRLRSGAEAVLLARSVFDTAEHEPIPTVAEAWKDPRKAEFFMGGKG